MARYVGIGLSLALAGCKGREKEAATGGTIVISVGADADYLFPPLFGTSVGRQVNEQIFDPLAMIGDKLNTLGDEGFTPRLAQRWEWSRDSLSIIFHLDPKARWHDGRPVTANDVRFTYQLYRDPALASPTAPLIASIDSVTVRDSLTPVFWFSHRSPQQFYVAVGQMLTIPQHVYGGIAPSALASSPVIRKPVGSGPFKFVRWVPGSVIELAANTNYYRKRASVDRVLWTIAPDFTTAVTRLMTGDADFFEAMRPENVAQAARTKTVRVVTYRSFDHGFMLFNMRDPKHHEAPHPLFGDRAVRRALTMAIDRVSIAKNVFDSLGAPSIGPMVRAMPTTDTTVMQIPYDPTAAAHLLDSLGWRDSNGDGIRDKQGRPFSFTVITPTSSKARQQCAILIQEQLRKIGVEMKIQPSEMNAFAQTESAHNFDAAMQVWHLDASPGTLQQIWGKMGASGTGGSNYGSYINPKFDAIVDSALNVSTLEGARPIFKRAYQTIIDDAPGVWLYEPKGTVGVHERIVLAPLRSDAWWAHLDEWSIPPNKRIARDQAHR